jgi:hypothetical protein
MSVAFQRQQCGVEMDRLVAYVFVSFENQPRLGRVASATAYRSTLLIVSENERSQRIDLS